MFLQSTDGLITRPRDLFVLHLEYRVLLVRKHHTSCQKIFHVLHAVSHVIHAHLSRDRDDPPPLPRTSSKIFSPLPSPRSISLTPKILFTRHQLSSWPSIIVSREPPPASRVLAADAASVQQPLPRHQRRRPRQVAVGLGRARGLIGAVIVRTLQRPRRGRRARSPRPPSPVDERRRRRPRR